MLKLQGQFLFLHVMVPWELADLQSHLVSTMVVTGMQGENSVMSDKEKEINNAVVLKLERKCFERF